ncbi:hypothetical protein JHK85_053031 [Glycine max]|nr:hypothetical protein JHK85_053031 [Glycine max]
MKKVLSFELLLILVIIHNKVINANNNNNCVTKDYLTGDDFESEFLFGSHVARMLYDVSKFVFGQTGNSNNAVVNCPQSNGYFVPIPSPSLTEARLFLSPIDACGPSLVPTSTPSPSLVVANLSTDEDVPTLAMETPPPSMIVLRLHLSMERYHIAIRQQFANPWPTWGAIPNDHQELFFQHFKKHWERERFSSSDYDVVFLPYVEHH